MSRIASLMMAFGPRTRTCRHSTVTAQSQHTQHSHSTAITVVTVTATDPFAGDYRARAVEQLHLAPTWGPGGAGGRELARVVWGPHGWYGWYGQLTWVVHGVPTGSWHMGWCGGPHGWYGSGRVGRAGRVVGTGGRCTLIGRSLYTDRAVAVH